MQRALGGSRQQWLGVCASATPTLANCVLRDALIPLLSVSRVCCWRFASCTLGERLLPALLWFPLCRVRAGDEVSSFAPNGAALESDIKYRRLILPLCARTDWVFSRGWLVRVESLWMGPPIAACRLVKYCAQMALTFAPRPQAARRLSGLMRNTWSTYSRESNADFQFSQKAGIYETGGWKDTSRGGEHAKQNKYIKNAANPWEKNCCFDFSFTHSC